MSARFNKPPGWPQPPAGWEPARDWAPDPSWPTPPLGWRLWIIDPAPQWPASAATAPIPSIPARPAAPPNAQSAQNATGRRKRPANMPRPANRRNPNPQPAPMPPAPPLPPSLTSMVIDLGTPAQQRARASGPTSARMIGWGALGGTVLLAVAGLTVRTLGDGTLTAAPPNPLVRSAQTATPSTSSADGPAPASSIDQASTRADAGTALAGLAKLTVQEREPSLDAARATFGSARRDTDANGCDQRNDVLRRDLTRTTLRAGTHGCAVLAGTLHDPYTGRKIKFRRTPGGHALVRIDHLVSVGDAWTKGARNWSAAKRTAFVTDPLNLQAVSAEVIADKGESDASGWLPQATEYRCTYVARQVAVKRKYGIWVTAAERTTIAGILAGCKGQRLPRAKLIELGGSPSKDVRTTRPGKSPRPAAPKPKSQRPNPKPADAAN
ncbi:MAG TPA: HNH endonuclease family protein [Kineosporiaceae bacterium]|nr:HNH endonuclease family protein [Kineosporiaceae bacterium]